MNLRSSWTQVLTRIPEKNFVAGAFVEVGLPCQAKSLRHSAWPSCHVWGIRPSDPCQLQNLYAAHRLLRGPGLPWHSLPCLWEGLPTLSSLFCSRHPCDVYPRTTGPSKPKNVGSMFSNEFGPLEQKILIHSQTDEIWATLCNLGPWTMTCLLRTWMWTEMLTKTQKNWACSRSLYLTSIAHPL